MPQEQVVGGVQRWPAVPQGDGVPEGTLVKSETKFFERKGGEPARGAFLLSQVHCPLCCGVYTGSQAYC